MTKLLAVQFEVDTVSDTAGLDSTDTASALAGCDGVQVASAILLGVVNLESGSVVTDFIDLRDKDDSVTASALAGCDSVHLTSANAFRTVGVTLL
jgi:hypothetical protein